VRTLIVVVLVALGAAAARGGTAAGEIAAHLRTETDECGLLLDLCRGVARTRDRGADTPGVADDLAFRNDAELRIRIDEARDAARVIRAKHAGKEPSCFRAPECRFLGSDAR
jgi:hypothetical protein